MTKLEDLSLDELAGRIERRCEPGELAYEIAGTIEHQLLKHGGCKSLKDWARRVQPDLDKVDRKLADYENAIVYAIGLLQIKGVTTEELHQINVRMPKSD